MREPRGFEGESGDSARGDGPPASKPLVVIERRGTGLLRGMVPPALIFATAAAILAYRVHEPDWAGLQPEEAPSSKAGDSPIVEPGPSPVAAPGPVVARIKSEEPAPPPPTAEAPPTAGFAPRPLPEAPAPRPAEVASTIRPPEPPPLSGAEAAFPAMPEPPPPVAKEEALDDIRREAARRHAERDEIERLKVREAARERAEERGRRAEQAERAIRFVEEDRPKFREALSQMLRAQGGRAASEIASLCRRHRGIIPADVKASIKQARLGVAARLSRRDRVELYRRKGMPEVMILDELAHEDALRIGTREGPRDRGDALVRAARRLLEIPLAAAEPVADAAAPPGIAPAPRPR